MRDSDWHIDAVNISESYPMQYEDEPSEPEPDEGAEEKADNDNKKEDTPGPPFGDTDEKHEQGPGEQARNTSKYMTKYERARILDIQALQISMDAPVMVALEGETDPLEFSLFMSIGELRNLFCSPSFLVAYDLVLLRLNFNLLQAFFNCFVS
ncbi:DNA-directed RNA polymerases II and V subunit 6B-like [Rhododendron vialii]|uniref:DNA-directed RNA polymerases II and V subunit 6B-like n=1 Tax=Rhododendron vialii TaxID=182163 RepID=UPI00265E8EA0|nr:DNA-directed RNA polymerases II and V subunit 6B-like [Rhododendron vialii]